MASILVLVQSNGHWDENNQYTGFEATGICIQKNCKYAELVDRLMKKHNCNRNSKVDKENEVHMLEYGSQSGGTPTHQQQENQKADNDEFDFLDYAKIIAAEMMAQLTRRTKDEQESNDEEALVITDKHHPEIEKGQMYKDKETLKNVLSYFAIKQQFQYKVKKSCTKEFQIKCLDKDCKWSLRASRNGTTENFVIRKYNEKHTCSLSIRFGDQRKASAKIIGDCVKYKFLNIKTTATPTNIRFEMNDKYGIQMNYMKAWRSREHALNIVRGKAKESYQLLPSYFYMLQKTNPGSVVHIKTEENNNFLFCFIALNASLKAWEKCRPIIVVDGTFLKATYGGTLLTASAQDAASKIFPLASCVADSENDLSWEWFFEKLRATFGVRQEQCVISGRHESIIKAAQQVFPEIQHGYCVYHLLNNLKTTFKKNARFFEKPFSRAAKAYTAKNFEYHMRELDALDRRVRPYLQKIGYDKWSRLYSKHKRYSTMTSNVAESLNAANLAARELPITTLMEALRTLIQEWTCKNRKMAQGTFTKLTPVAEMKMKGNYKTALKLKVRASNEHIFEVYKVKRSRVVNLEQKTCTCNRFQIDEMPCAHALAVMKEMYLDPQNYCSDYYSTKNWLETYEATVYPVGKQSNWDIPQEIKDIEILPPLERVKAGRPKKKRTRPSWETKTQIKCTKCGR
ncbi:uncharacterized protein LOC115700082 [Cannabis sativa]|uniref:uncharacterized protein LOC115700082 n=1 Tax=Cannabis sativa TaxID=3483 RepID=UPI0029C9B305|nr:uncharacterized protein LOC115700082 [Cannabis sativa]